MASNFETLYMAVQFLHRIKLNIHFLIKLKTNTMCVEKQKKGKNLSTVNDFFDVEIYMYIYVTNVFFSHTFV